MKPNFVSGFPYNCVPHPMIVGSMIGLLGFHKMASFRAALPYLVPMHCAMYMTHMIQEQVRDIYKKDFKRTAARARRGGGRGKPRRRERRILWRTRTLLPRRLAAAGGGRRRPRARGEARVFQRI